MLLFTFFAQFWWDERDIFTCHEPACFSISSIRMVTRAAKGSKGVGTRSYTMTVVRTADTLIYIYKHQKRHKRGCADRYINCCLTVFSIFLQ